LSDLSSRVAGPARGRFTGSLISGELCVELGGTCGVENQSGEVSFQFGAAGHPTPGGDGKDFVGAFLGKSEFSGLAAEALAEFGAPCGEVCGGFDVMSGNPGQPLIDLALMTPGLGGDGFEGGFDVDHQVASIAAGHVAVIGVEDDGRGNPLGQGFVGDGVFAEEGVRHVDHVSDTAHSFGHGEVVGMDSGEGIGREWGTEEVIRLEFADGTPQGGEEVVGERAARLLKGLSGGFAEQFELVLADGGAGLLFGESNAGRFGAAAEMMSRTAVGADENTGPEVGACLTPHPFEGAGGDEFEIIKVGVDTEDAHGERMLWIGGFDDPENGGAVQRWNEECLGTWIGWGWMIEKGNFFGGPAFERGR